MDIQNFQSNDPNVQNFRSLTEEEIQIIHKIFSSKDLLHKPIEEFTKGSFVMGVGGAGGAVGAGGVAVGQQVAQGAAMSGAAAAGGIAAATVIGFTLVGIAGLGGYCAYVHYDSRQKYLKAVKDQGIIAEESMLDCLKEEYNDKLKALNEKLFSILDHKSYMNRDHELINSWFKIKDMSFLEDELTEVQRNQYNRYLANIKKYVKEDQLGEFNLQMRRYCAANNLGEFSKTLPTWPSLEYKERKLLKEKIINRCFTGTNKEKEEKFEKVTTYFYATYKAMIFLHTAGREDIHPSVIKNYLKNLDDMISNNVEKDKIPSFNQLFRKYRYLGGRCEFDRNNIFEMERFEKYFYSVDFMEECKKEPEVVLSTLAIAGVANAFTLGFANLVFPFFVNDLLERREAEAANNAFHKFK